MGKSRRNRGKANRSDPIAKPVKPPSDPELAAIRESRILPVIKDLKSTEPKSRTAAASAISNIVQDAKCRKLLLREQIVHIVLTETLTDSALESRAAGWEILRVLSEEEESDFCVHLYRLDVITAMEHAAAKVIATASSSLTDPSKPLKVQQQLTWGIAQSLVGLLNGLALAGEHILDRISVNAVLIRFVVLLSMGDFAAQEVGDDALACLMTLSEDNGKLAQKLADDKEHRSLERLEGFTSANDHKAALACGVLHNIFAALEWYDQSPGPNNACDAVLVPRLSALLKQAPSDERNPTIQLALQILALIASESQLALEKESKSHRKGKGKRGPTHEQMDRGGSDEDSGDEMPEDDDDEMADGDLEKDAEMVTGADDDVEEMMDTEADDLPTLGELIKSAVPEISRLASLGLDDAAASMIQIPALEALNNIAWTVSMFDFSENQNAGILGAWTPAARSIWSETITPILASDTADLNLATAITGLAWAVARTLRGDTPVSGDEHQRFVSLYQASKGLADDKQAPEDPFQGLGVKCVGVLGQLAFDPAPIGRNRDIGVFLLTVLESLPDTAPADAVETVNQLVDIYGDEDFACDREVFWKDNFLQHLENAIPKIKAMTKLIDKRASSELRFRADEAALNLRRFIAYKKEHMPQATR